MSEIRKTSPAKPVPWWKFGYMWLVVGGPTLVVIASLITLYLAVTRPDPVLDPNYYQKGIALGKTPGAGPDSLAPAMQARNHAATGVPAPKPIDAP